MLVHAAGPRAAFDGFDGDSVETPFQVDVADAPGAHQIRFVLEFGLDAQELARRRWREQFIVDGAQVERADAVDLVVDFSELESAPASPAADTQTLTVLDQRDATAHCSGGLFAEGRNRQRGPQLLDVAH